MKNIRTFHRYATDRMLHKMKLIKIQSHAVHILKRCFYYEKKLFSCHDYSDGNKDDCNVDQPGKRFLLESKYVICVSFKHRE